MQLRSFEAIVRSLNRAAVKFVVVGGLAVNAHGYVRHTKDVDLVIALNPDNVRRAFEALAQLGFQPLVPVTADGFGDAEQRESWRREKHMQVLNFFSDEHKTTSVDVFVFEPFDFEREYKEAMVGELADDLEARFVGIPALIDMKRQAGRARDLDDIEHLQMILEDQINGQ